MGILPSPEIIRIMKEIENGHGGAEGIDLVGELKKLWSTTYGVEDEYDYSPPKPEPEREYIYYYLLRCIQTVGQMRLIDITIAAVS